MAMTKCTECGQESSTKAASCPKCGSRHVEKAGCAKVILTAFAGLVLVVILAQFATEQNGTNSQVAATAASEADLPSYTASDLARDYNDNTVAADQKYKGKKYKVSGAVVDISTDFLGKPYITLRGGVNEFMEPQFSFVRGQDKALAALKRGDRVTLICTGSGDVAKTAMSESCTLL